MALIFSEQKVLCRSFASEWPDRGYAWGETAEVLKLSYNFFYLGDNNNININKEQACSTQLIAFHSNGSV